MVARPAVAVTDLVPADGIECIARFLQFFERGDKDMAGRAGQERSAYEQHVPMIESRPT